ncbi:hypothetical protein [Chamaesiphon sp. VAR_69_metabat_338]|uniref:hypothetical protein n=1 Tax=Chamaesiphon sp. VAR_69_metabat_338 TaxID=2964704 RepID=UPI00286DD5D8|nr:hypothetical protein [Chamaesiphon sp. VAR_69_metabat_338]
MSNSPITDLETSIYPQCSGWTTFDNRPLVATRCAGSWILTEDVLSVFATIGLRKSTFHQLMPIN